jgi:hypothetical protein
MKKLSQLLQLFLGSFLGLGLIGAVVAAGLFIMVQQLTARPPKPVYDNDDPNFSARPKPSPSSIASPTASGSGAESPSPSPSSSPLPEGSYRATVSYSEGLSIRDAPDGNRTGGLDYNEEIVVLEESSDKLWLKIRSERTQVEGWIKAGNVSKIE